MDKYLYEALRGTASEMQKSLIGFGVHISFLEAKMFVFDGWRRGYGEFLLKNYQG